jgi:hypothetical protein
MKLLVVLCLQHIPALHFKLPPRLSTWTRILDAAGCTSDIKGIHTAILAPSRADLDEWTGERLRVGSRQPVNHERNN